MYFNPLDKDYEISTKYDGDVIYKLGSAEIKDGKIHLHPQSFLMIET